MAARSDFKGDFYWGTATAAYQIEGAVTEDGKGQSNWDHFSRIPGNIKDGTGGDIACDHYHLWRDDIKLMAWLGVNTYRFSICWARISPGGKGRLNQPGVDFYSRLIDSLLENGITPFVTIWHGDHPQVLDEDGGWANRDMIARYADHAAGLFDRFGDRVQYWITLNEPNCFLYQGFGDGRCPPGKTDWRLAYQAVHNALVAHGEAARRAREIRPQARIGITMSSQLWSPATDSEQDHRAAQLADLQNNLWLLDPLHGKGYPKEYVAYLGDLAPEIRDGDLDTIAMPTDFLAVNYYQNMMVCAGTLKACRSGLSDDYLVTEQKNDADGFRRGLERLNRLYGPRTFFVTENGLQKKDETLGPDGTCHDPDRVAYLQSHTQALLDAVSGGMDVRGYFIWTLMDNFEWSAGHAARFGLFFTDYPRQRRIPKSSAKWYRDFLGS